MENNRFKQEDLVNFEPDGKVGLLATVTPDNLPHITLITAMQASDPEHLIFGQFCEGRSKQHLEENPRAGFLLMTLARKVWKGRARWTGKIHSGPDHEMMNKKPMWRYNAYFSIHTVHYLDLVAVGEGHPLPLGAVTGGMVKSMLTRPFLRKPEGPEVMNPWTTAFIGKPGNLKFLAWIGEDGFPRIIPQLGAVTLNSREIYIPGVEYREEFRQIPDGANVALFAMALTMEDVLVRGTFRRRGAGGRLSVDWVYNSMPPVAEQIYPPVNLAAKVVEF